MSGNEFGLTRHVFRAFAHELTWSGFERPRSSSEQRAIICIPGYASTGESFARLRPLASRYDLRLVTFDEDDRDRGFDLLGSLARRIVEFTREFDRPILLGTSFGGLVALRAAASLGQTIRGLVLISTYLTLESLHDLPAARRLGLLGGVGRVASALGDTALRIVAGTPLDSAAAREIRREASSIPAGEMSDRLQAALHADLRGIATAVRVPAVVIHGSRDYVVPLPLARSLAASLPAACFEVIPGAGHLPYLTHPGEVLAVLGAFADTVFEPGHAMANA